MSLLLLDNFENKLVFEVIEKTKNEISKIIHVISQINSKGFTIFIYNKSINIPDFIDFKNYNTKLINSLIEFAKNSNSEQILSTKNLVVDLNNSIPPSIKKLVIKPIYINSLKIANLILGISKENDNELYFSILEENIKTIQNNIINSINFSFFQKRNQFFNISLDLMFVANLRGEILDLNPQVEAFLGLTKDEIISHSILNYFHKEDIPKTIHTLGNLKKNKVLKGFSTRILSKDKQYKNIQWNAISDEKHIYVVGRDLTEDENIKNELIKVNSILQQAEKVTKMGAWELDVATGLTYWTDEVYAIHELDKGFDHNKLNGIEFYHPDYRKIIADAIEKTIDDRIPFDVTCKFIGAKGTLKWVRSSGIPLVENEKVIKIFGVFIDITEEEENKIKAELEKFKLDAIIQGTNIGTWEWNIQTGETVFNHKWAEIIGYTLDELMPVSIDTWMKFAHPKDLKTSEELLNLHFSGKTDFYSFESRMLHKNGNWIWVLDRGKVVSWTNDGKPLMMYGTHQDITIQKELELNLINQNLLVSQFFDLSPIGLAVNEFNGGKFLSINKALLNIVGYSQEEFLKLSYFDLTPEKYYPEELIMIESLKKNGVYGPFEKEYIHKNGNLIPVLLKGVLVKDEIQGDKIWSVIEDISERKKNEGIQKWNYDFQKLIAKHSSIFVKTSEYNFNENINTFLKEIGEFFNVDRAYIFVSDDNLRNVSNEFEWCNVNIQSEKQNLKSVAMDEFKFLKTNLNQFGFAHLPNLNILIDSKEKEEYQRQKIQSLLCAEISVQDKKIGFIGFDSIKVQKEWSSFEIHSLKLLSNTLADLFLKKEKENLLIENQQKLQSVLDEIEDVVWSVDANDFSLIFISPSVEKLFGYSILEWKKNTLLWRDLVHVEDKYLLEIADLDLKNKGEYNFEYRMVSKSGEIKWVKTRVKKVFNKNGVARIDGYITDITKQKKYLNSIEESKKIAESALKVKDEFLANISHEIRTPLNAIMGFGEILEKTNLSYEQKEVVEIISLASKKLMNILNDVLDVAKFNDGIIELELKSINLHQLTKEIIFLQGVKAHEKNIELKYIIHENVPQFIIGDETRLNQILINLINNAIKFTEKGWVKLEVREINRDNLNTWIQFTISDSGIGIPVEKQNLIFERFVQAEASTSRKYGGTGLGLSIVKSLIELYHGKISLSSDGVNGTQFTVELPFKISNINLTENPISLEQKDTSVLNNKKVLLVEDNDFNQILAKNILQQFSIQVDTAKDGYEALELVQNKTYDIILMDLQMPNLDGYSTSKIIINDLGITTPIIACSAHAQKKEKEECKKIGMVDYLSKPYTKIELIDILCNHIQTSISNNFSVDKQIQDIQDGIQKVKRENGLDLFNILSDLYVKRIPTDLKQIEFLLQEQNLTDLAVIIHKLIGSFGTMNFYEACKICKKIENDLKSNSYSSINLDIEMLSSYIHNSIKILNSL